MCATGQAVCGSIRNGLTGGGEIMPAVNTLQRRIVNAFHAILYHDVMPLLDFVEQQQDVVIDQIGACADNNANDSLYIKGFTVSPFQFVQRLVSVGIGLKISQVAAGTTVTFLMKGYAFFDLLPDGLVGTAVGRVESRIAAKGTAAGAYGAVAVRTAKTRIDADFLHTTAELTAEISPVTVETALVAPKEGVCAVHLMEELINAAMLKTDYENQVILHR